MLKAFKKTLEEGIFTFVIGTNFYPGIDLKLMIRQLLSLLNVIFLIVFSPYIVAISRILAFLRCPFLQRWSNTVYVEN